MSDIRGLWQQMRREAGLLDVRHETLASLTTARQQRRQATVPSADSYERSGNMILIADFCTPPTNKTRQAGNVAHNGDANSNMGRTRLQ